ncbi:hypothetical protein [Marinicellulosiphila megalodicopiae]|uniref:hypothetical protein n=1 Tax=Marinicellulosiphila megalodicopiae TaxID=2724896 RepID=UPI003BB084F3
MFVYFIQMIAKVGINHKEIEKVEGCICNCWIQSDDKDQAKEKAKQLLLEHDWEFQSFEQVNEDSSQNYSDGNEGLHFFEQAQQSGCAHVFHIWDKPNVNREEI